MSQHLEIRDLKRQLSESRKEILQWKLAHEQLKKDFALSQYFVESNDLRKTITKLVKQNDLLKSQLDLYSKELRKEAQNIYGEPNVRN